MKLIDYIISYRSKAVVMLWVSVACFDDVSPYIRGLSQKVVDIFYNMKTTQSIAIKFYL